MILRTDDKSSVNSILDQVMNICSKVTSETTNGYRFSNFSPNVIRKCLKIVKNIFDRNTMLMLASYRH